MRLLFNWQTCDTEDKGLNSLVLNFTQHNFSPKTAAPERFTQKVQFEHQHLSQFAIKEVRWTMQLRQCSTRWSPTSLKRVSVPAAEAYL
ncbi:hypothetical protein ABVT39_022450, partial [Epinephelus coioides]